MFQTKQISDIKIKPVIKQSKYTKDTVRAYDYYPEPFSNISLIARKKSGKTNVIYRALEKCAKKGTNVYIFAPTVHKDETYERMIKMLKKKKCIVMANEHFIDDNGVNLISEILQVLNDEDENQEDQDQDNQEIHHPPPMLFFGDDKHYKREAMLYGGGCRLVERPEPKKPKKEPKKGKGEKLITPDHIFVFDDLSNDLHNKHISKLLAKNRHYKLKTFFSCHSVNNLEPQAIGCIDTFHLFRAIPNTRIDELKEKADITFKNDNKHTSKLQEIYDFATKEPFSFLTIDRNDGSFRKNFNEKIIVDSE